MKKRVKHPSTVSGAKMLIPITILLVSDIHFIHLINEYLLSA